MIIKFIQYPNQIFILEAVSDGVRLVSWQQLRQYIGPNKFYAHVAVRYVQFVRDQQMYINLMRFVDESLGLEYGLTTEKLLKTKSIALPPVIHS